MIEAIQQLPPQLATFLLSMLPITELRLTIPMAIGLFDLPVWQIYLYAVLGNLVPAFFIIWFIKPVSEWLRSHSKLFEKFFNWWFGKVVKKFEGKFIRYGELALILFVAIPLPITGAWTGSVASYLFKISRKRAIIFVCIGVLIAGIIVTLLSTGAFAFAKTF